MARRRTFEYEKRKSSASKCEVKVPSVSYLTLYRFASKWDKLLITVALLAVFIAGITLPYAITIVAHVFQSMINYDKSVKAGIKDDAVFLESMHQFGIRYSCVGVILFTGGYLGTALMNIAAIHQVFKMRQAYLRAALNQDFKYFDMRQTGDFASKMADDAIKLEEGIGDKLSALVYNLTIAIGCIVMSMIKGWKLALLCLTTAPLSFLLVGLTSKLAQRLSKEGAVQSGLASAIAEEVLSSIRTVYAFNGQQKEIERYKVPLAKSRRIEIKKEFFSGLSAGCLFFCVFCSYALSFYFGIYLIINDPENYNADVMFSVFFGVMTGLGNFGMVGSLVGSFASARGAGAQIFHLLDNVPTINPLLDRGIKPDAVEGNLELKNVVFHYPSRPSTPVLQGVSLTVKRGQSVALVGHSGCGKSTIIQLLSRYYDVIDGSVSLDGRDVRQLSVRWLRAQIGLVGQEPVLFNTSVRQNIRYGRERASDADIEAAARQANAHHFIMKLPKLQMNPLTKGMHFPEIANGGNHLGTYMGYDTLVGECGASLSGGQKQRIAIARALVRNPSILLLDEATSALDTASEAKVQMALEKAAEGRTTLIVAHRLSTIRNVNVIYVMKDGQVTESGSHDELIRLRGHYFEMLSVQEPQGAGGTEVGTISMREDSKESDFELDDQLSAVPSEDNKKSKEPALSFWRVVKLNSPEWKAITAGSVSSILIGCAMPLFIVVFGDLFGSMSDTDPSKLMDKVNKVSTGCVVIGLVMGSSSLIESVAFGIAGARLTERLRRRMFARLLRQHVGYFDERANSTGALCARLSAEAAYVQGATGQRIGVLLQGVGSVGLALALALVYEWRVGMVALAFCPLVALVVYYQGRTTCQESFGNAKMLENSTKIAIEAVSNIRTVASLGRERSILEEYEAALRPALGPARTSAHLRGVVAGMSRSMFNFINSAALTYGGYLIVSEGVAYENILVTTQSLQMASGQAQNAFTYAPDFQKGIKAASRVVALLHSKTKISDPPTPAVTPFKASGDATFKEVVFRYPSRPGVQVLRGLNLQIERGKTIALVGKSGCGKSTLIKLLQRYYDPESGIVALDGVPISNLRVSDVRASFGLVSQEPVLFDRSIRENIAYGDNSRCPTLGEIEDAAMEANIHHFIVSLPEGYETNIGSKGIQLSGGQKQRVAIARALIRRPKILLLDEATSALDTESEKVVQEALDRAKAGRTCVMIAHRLSTVRDADAICVVSDGQVAERGTHADLIDLKGLYYNLNRRGYS